MALNIDKKVYRNIQEQVAWLTTTVAEIIDITDAEKLEDLVDELEGYKNTFEGYADIMAGYANTMGDYATTMQGYANTMGDYATTMQGYASQVNTWSNNIAGAALSVINSNNVTPLSVRQQNFNYEKTLVFSTSGPAGNLTKLLGYCRFAEINNQLHIIVNITLTNNTGTTVSLNQNNDILTLQAAYISEIASKVINFDGNSASQADLGNTLVSMFHVMVSKDKNGSSLSKVYDATGIIFTAEANYLRGKVQLHEAVSLDNGESIYISGRTVLTLI